LGTLRILEAVRILGLTKKTRVYQASTSECMEDWQRIKMQQVL
jgi:GDP-D-mannose dehydratase